MKHKYRLRRTVTVFAWLIMLSFVIIGQIDISASPSAESEVVQVDGELAIDKLRLIKIDSVYTKTEYSRDFFGSDWGSQNGCDTRNIILFRDLNDAMVDDSCNVISGILNDPYTGKTISFVRGASTSADVQIDHVVALSDAWKTGAAYMTSDERYSFANDPLELLAVDGGANIEKSDSSASEWLPDNVNFRCQYVARQIEIKHKYNLWMTPSEYFAIEKQLSKCPYQLLPD